MRGQRHAPAAFCPRERPGTHCTGGWVGPWARQERSGISPPTGIRSPDRSARSQSLYRMRYPAHAEEVSRSILKKTLAVNAAPFFLLQTKKISILTTRENRGRTFFEVSCRRRGQTGCCNRCVNRYKMERRPLHIKTQSVPRCRHFPSRL
jgi:hypothetical protein